MRHSAFQLAAIDWIQCRRHRPHQQRSTPLTVVLVWPLPLPYIRIGSVIHASDLAERFTRGFSSLAGSAITFRFKAVLAICCGKDRHATRKPKAYAIDRVNQRVPGGQRPQSAGWRMLSEAWPPVAHGSCSWMIVYSASPPAKQAKAVVELVGPGERDQRSEGAVRSNRS